MIRMKKDKKKKVKELEKEVKKAEKKTESVEEEKDEAHNHLRVAKEEIETQMGIVSGLKQKLTVAMDTL